MNGTVDPSSSRAMAASTWDSRAESSSAIRLLMLIMSWRHGCSENRMSGGPPYTLSGRLKARDLIRDRAIAYEKFGRWFDAEEPLLRAKERTDAGSSPFRHPRSELIAPLLQEAPSAFNNRKLHMRLPWRKRAAALEQQQGGVFTGWQPDGGQSQDKG